MHVRRCPGARTRWRRTKRYWTGTRNAAYRASKSKSNNDTMEPRFGTTGPPRSQRMPAPAVAQTTCEPGSPFHGPKGSLCSHAAWGRFEGVLQGPRLTAFTRLLTPISTLANILKSQATSVCLDTPTFRGSPVTNRTSVSIEPFGSTVSGSIPKFRTLLSVRIPKVSSQTSVHNSESLHGKHHCKSAR